MEPIVLSRTGTIFTFDMATPFSWEFNDALSDPTFAIWNDSHVGDVALVVWGWAHVVWYTIGYKNLLFTTESGYDSGVISADYIIGGDGPMTLHLWIT